MSHPDPLYDYDEDRPDYDDHDCYEDEVSPEGYAGTDDVNYDDYNDFYDDHGSIEDWPGECEDDYDDSMDGDHDSAMTSCGWGTDEDYGHYSDYDREDFYSDDGYGSYDDGY